MAWTKEKQAAYMKEYRKRNRDKFLAAQRRHREKDKEAYRSYQRTWCANNKERTKAYRDRFNDHNPDAHRLYRQRWLATKAGAVENKRARFRKWYYRNQEEQIARTVRWGKDNAERARAYRRASAHRRRAWKQRSGGAYTDAQWQWLLVLCKNRCLCCRHRAPRVKLEPDHVIPLCKQGRNELANLQPLCSACNRAKGRRATDYRNDRIKLAIGEYMVNLLQSERCRGGRPHTTRDQPNC